MKNKNEEFINFMTDYLRTLEEEARGGCNDKAYIKQCVVEEIQEVFYNKYNEIVLGFPVEKA